MIDLGEYLYSPQMEWANYLSRIGLRIDRNRSNWGKVKNYPKNTEIETAGTYTSGSSTVPVNLRYSFSEIPQTGYKPRIADHRIGYFLTAKKDYSLKGAEEPFVRYINRWHLEKADLARNSHLRKSRSYSTSRNPFRMNTVQSSAMVS